MQKRLEQFRAKSPPCKLAACVLLLLGLFLFSLVLRAMPAPVDDLYKLGSGINAFYWPSLGLLLAGVARRQVLFSTFSTWAIDTASIIHEYRNVETRTQFPNIFPFYSYEWVSHVALPLVAIALMWMAPASDFQGGETKIRSAREWAVGVVLMAAFWIWAFVF